VGYGAKMRLTHPTSSAAQVLQCKMPVCHPDADPK
jgi:hypothetical protein